MLGNAGGARATTTNAGTLTAEQKARHEPKSVDVRSRADRCALVAKRAANPLPVGEWRPERLVLIAPVVPSPRPDPVPPPGRVRGLRASAARAFQAAVPRVRIS